VTVHSVERLVGGLFGLTFLSGVALLVLYVVGGQTQLEGVLLAICLGGLGTGIVLWSQDLMNTPPHIEARHPLTSGRAVQESVADAITEEAGFTRRTMLVRMLVLGIAGLGAALVVPVFSLGPLPGAALFHTAWRKGSRLVDAQGHPVNTKDLPLDSIITVFPEGAPGDATAQALLIHAPADQLRLPDGRADWAPQGYVCFSKICTHAGCPVGLSRAVQRQLICPSHQSTFDVLRGAVPIFGPAARPLPQLPIALESDGGLVAQGDFPEPVGPSFWNRTWQG
jgi:ubiquinol-cytochrome c reductase iron-sulfur subunit